MNGLYSRHFFVQNSVFYLFLHYCIPLRSAIIVFSDVSISFSLATFFKNLLLCALGFCSSGKLRQWALLTLDHLPDHDNSNLDFFL